MVSGYVEGYGLDPGDFERLGMRAKRVLSAGCAERGAQLLLLLPLSGRRDMGEYVDLIVTVLEALWREGDEGCDWPGWVARLLELPAVDLYAPEQEPTGMVLQPWAAVTAAAEFRLGEESIKLGQVIMASIDCAESCEDFNDDVVRSADQEIARIGYERRLLAAHEPDIDTGLVRRLRHQNQQIGLRRGEGFAQDSLAYLLRYWAASPTG